MKSEKIIEVPIFDEKLPFIVTTAGITYSDPNYFIEREKSSITVIEYIIKGKGFIVSKNKTIPVASGDTYLLTLGNNHKYYADKSDPWEKVWINIRGELVSSLIQAYSVGKQIVYRCDSENYLRRIHSLLADKSLSPAEISAKSSIVFHEFIQFLAANGENKEKITQEAELLKNYIDTNIYRQIGISELAKLIYKSTTHTIRIFKNAYGITPYEYYMNNRIKKAAALLKESSYSVKEIAYMLNFGDEHYFSNIFKQKTGKTPSEYR